MPAPPIQIAVTANANPLYDEIIRQARRAEAAVKKIPLRIETKDLGGFKTLTADIDRFDKSVSRMSAVITTFGQAAAVIFGIQNAFAAMVKTSVRVEKQLNDINAIFGASNKTMKQFSDGLFEVAKQTGQSFDVAATAAQEFARQGLSVEQTLKRTRDALTLTRISGLDAANATQSLTSILNTFKKEALDSTKVTNILANVDTKFAVSAADLTEALKRAGASAADARVPFNELVAAVTSLQQSTARGGSVIGNSLKSIFTRVQRGDTIDALRAIGVEVRDAEGKTKPMLNTLQDLASKFRGLSDATRASVKEQVAGVYQINQLSALLADLSSGYSTYKKALEVANGTQNEAIDRLAVLKNVTAGSLNDTLANLTKFAAESGKIVINPIIKNASDTFNTFFDKSDGVSQGEEFGLNVGEGVLKGIGSYLSSGGAIIIGKAMFNIFRLVAAGVRDQVVAATTLNRQSEKKLFLQEQIKSVLLSTNPIYQSMIKSASSEAEKRQIVLNILRQQEAALLSINSLSSKFASQSLKEGLTSLSSPVKTPRKLFGRAAGGFLPSMIAEKQAVNKGVGGAPKSAKPVVIPNFNLGGGKMETIVANSSEYIVPNYANGGSAIFNQDMVKSMGLPKGARKIMAGGFIPNFAGFGQYDNQAKKIQDFFIKTFKAKQFPKTNIQDFQKSTRFRKYYGLENSNEFGGFFDPNNKNIYINKNQSDRDKYKTLIHEAGHAAEDYLTSSQRSKLYRALEIDFMKRGESVGETFLGSHARSYNNAEFSESFAESANRIIAGGGSRGKNSLMYRYMRRFISKRFAGGFIPNFKLPGKLVGEGSFGAFYKLKNNIGVKRFHSTKYPDDLINEFIASKVLESEKILPGVRGPKVFGNLKRSLSAGRIGKEVVNDPLAENSLVSGYKVSKVLEDMLMRKGVGSTAGSDSAFLDMNTGNFTVNNAGAEMLNSEKGRSLLSKYRYDERALDKLSRFFEKKGGLINIIDPGYLKFPDKIAKKYKAGGYIPNFNPLLSSLQREASSLQELGYSKEQIFKGLRVQPSPRLTSKDNPSGLGVFNTLQNQHTIGQALRDHSGENIHKSGIPNFAPRQDYRAIRQTIQDISGGVRDPSAKALPKTFNASAIVSLSAQIDGMTKNAKLFNKAAPILVGRLNREIEQVDKTLAAGNLSIKAQNALNSQRKLLVVAQDKILDKSSSDLSLLRRPVIRDTLLSRKENVRAAIEERKASEEATRQRDQQEAERISAAKDQKKQERQNRNTNRLLALSFIGPLATEGLLNAFGSGNEKNPTDKFLSSLSSNLSTGLALSTLGPAGAVAGAGVALLGGASSFIKSRNEFAGQELTTQELGKITDSNQRQSAKSGEFFEAFDRFSNSSGADKVIARENLKKALSSFEDKKLATEIAKISFDTNKSFDDKILAQRNLFGADESARDIKQNEAAVREFFAQIVDGTSVFTRLNNQVDFAPQKINQFVDLLSNNISSQDLKKTNITDTFVSSLIKNTGLNLEKFAGNATIDALPGLLKIALQRRQSTNSFLEEQESIGARKASVRTTTLDTGRNLLNRTSLLSELRRNSLFETANARLESPIFNEEAKVQASFELRQKSIVSGLIDSISELGKQFNEEVRNDSGISGSTTFDLISKLSSATINNDAESILKSFSEFKGLSEDGDKKQKELVETAKKQFDIAKSQLSTLEKLKEIQSKNAQQKALLDYFNKSGLKGADNLGSNAANKSSRVIAAQIALKEAERLSSEVPDKNKRVLSARNILAQARISKFEDDVSRGLGPKSDQDRASSISKLTPDVLEVTRNKLLSDLFGAIDSIKSSEIGSSIETSLSRFEKIAQSGDISKLPTELTRFGTNAKISLRNSGVPSKNPELILGSFVQTLSELTTKLDPSNLESIAKTETERMVGGTTQSISEIQELNKILNPTTSSLLSSTLSFDKSAKELADALAKYKIETEKLQQEESKKKLDSESSAQKKTNTDNRLNLDEKIILFNKSLQEFQQNYTTRDQIVQLISPSGSVKGGKDRAISDYVSGENLENLIIRAPELAQAIDSLREEFKKNNIKSNPSFKSPISLVSQFDPYASAIRRAKNREIRAGIPSNQIYTDTDKRLISPTNPMGLMVANYLDEPNGGFEGVDRKIKRGLNPKLNESRIPNFALTEKEKREYGEIFPIPGTIRNATKNGYGLVYNSAAPNTGLIGQEGRVRMAPKNGYGLIYDSAQPNLKVPTGPSVGKTINPLDLQPGGGLNFDKATMEEFRKNRNKIKGKTIDPSYFDPEAMKQFRTNRIDKKNKNVNLGQSILREGDIGYDEMYNKFFPNTDISFEKAVSNLKKRKAESGRFDSSGNYILQESQKPFYMPGGNPRGVINGKPSSAFNPRNKQSVVQSSKFASPNLTNNSNAGSGTFVDMNYINELKSLVAEMSNIAIKVQNESQRSLRLDINGSSSAVKDFQEMEDRILNKVMTLIDRNKTLSGERKSIIS